jgi:WD40 repeat protein
VGWLEATRPDEFREFSVSPMRFDQTGCLFSPDGAILISGNLTNAILSDPLTGSVIYPIKGTRITSAIFDPLDRAFFVAGTRGLFRYEYNLSLEMKITFRNGQRLHKGMGWHAFAFTPDGRWFGAANSYSNAAFVFDRSLTNVVARLGPHRETDSLTLSSDARWLTTGSFKDGQIRVWDVSRQSLVKALPVGRMPQAVFSSDGRWLATFGDAFELRETRTWEPAPALPFPDGRPVLGAGAFSPDGRLLAVVANHGTVHLIDLHRYQSLGVLRPPGLVSLSALTFSLDGSRLVAVGQDARTLIWDLREIRGQLMSFGLDWYLPSIPSAVALEGGEDLSVDSWQWSTNFAADDL